MLMPLMHSESLDDQDFGLPYFKKYTNPKTYEYALKHKEVIKKFGRFPHRNRILNRNSTQSELEFLKITRKSVLNQMNVTSIKIGNKPSISVDYSGEGEMIIFLHGIGGNKKNWKNNINFFAKKIF